MRAWLSLCVALCVAALSGVAHAQGAQGDPAQCHGWAQVTRSLTSQFLTPGHATVLRELEQSLPQECVRLRASLAQAIVRMAEDSRWRMFRDGQIVEVAPPPAQPFNSGVWPVQLSVEMLAKRPSVDEVRRLHPERARERGQVGAVIVEGRVRDDGTLAWRVMDVTPTGWGFEDAALRAGALYEAPLHFEDGRTTVGASFMTVIVFDAPRPRPIYYD